MIDKIIVTFLAFCGIFVCWVLLYIITGSFGIPFTITSLALAYLVADKIL